MSKINALLVDPYRGELRHIEVENSIKVWHALLQCNCCDVRKIIQAPWGVAVDVWFDDEYKIRQPDQGPSFRLGFEPPIPPLVICGYGLICARDTEGASISLGDEGFACSSHTLIEMLKLNFEHWQKRGLKTDSYIDQLLRTPETEPGLSGKFRYLDIPQESGMVRTS